MKHHKKAVLINPGWFFQRIRNRREHRQLQKVRRSVAAALHAELETTKRSLDCAHSNFENVLDPDLIDCYIYEVNAAQLRYTFLLKQLKEFEEKIAVLP